MLPVVFYLLSFFEINFLSNSKLKFANNPIKKLIMYSMFSPLLQKDLYLIVKTTIKRGVTMYLSGLLFKL